MAGGTYPVGITTSIDRASPVNLVRNAIDGMSIGMGLVDGYSVVHKFGRNPAVGTAFSPVCIGGIWRTPQIANATALRVKAGNAADAPGGVGAREVKVECISPIGERTIISLATNGTSAGPVSSEEHIRGYRAWVSESGTYTTDLLGSHTGDIVIENAAGTEDWLTIDATDIARGQSECAVYTVRLGTTAWIKVISITVDSNKAADVVFFHREGILKTAAPYDALRAQRQFTGLISPTTSDLFTLRGPYPALTDIGFMAKVATGTGALEIEFEIIEIAD